MVHNKTGINSCRTSAGYFQFLRDSYELCNTAHTNAQTQTQTHTHNSSKTSPPDVSDYTMQYIQLHLMADGVNKIKHT